MATYAVSFIVEWIGQLGSKATSFDSVTTIVQVTERTLCCQVLACYFEEKHHTL